jgi:hypothetical protein
MKEMKPRGWLAMVAMGLLCVGTSACGDAVKSVASAPATSTVSTSAHTAQTHSAPGIATVAPPGHYLKRDDDGTYDDKGGSSYYAHHPDDDEIFLAEYGKEADPTDKREITKVVMRYYEAAGAGDGAKACALLAPSLAKATVEVHGQGAGSGSSGNKCAAILTTMFKRQRAELLADEIATMRVFDIHVKNNVGVAVLGFRRVPERQILVAREGSRWTIDALLDGEMT